jgi:hypothetical protein
MFKQYDYSPYSIPTDEDRLDINFRSIVSDLRGITRGTLAPRSWADLSSTWTDGVVNRVMHVKATDRPQKRKNYYQKVAVDHRTKPYYTPRVRKTRDVMTSNQRAMNRLARLLTSGGMNVWDARMKARQLLGGE